MKKIYTLICIALLSIASINAYSQVPPFTNPAIYGDAGGDDNVLCMIAASDGGYFATGFFFSTSITLGSVTLTNSGAASTADAFIARFDASGDVLWAINPPGIASDYGFAIDKDNADNIYVTGAFDSPTIIFGSITLNRGGFSDMFIAKYNSNGNVVWAKRFGGNSNTQGINMKVNQSSVYVEGNFDSSTLTLGSTTLNNPNLGYSRVFYTKLDTAGTVLWAKMLAPSNYASNYFGITTDISDNLILTGNYFGSGFIVPGLPALAYASSQEAFITKIDPSGNALWTKVLAGPDSIDAGYAVLTDQAGNIYCSGYFKSTTLTLGTTVLTHSPGNSRDIFIAKYSGSGNLLWAKSTGSNGDDEAYTINIDHCGFIYVGGLTQSTVPFNFGSTTNISSSGASDALLLKYDANGNELFAKTITGSNIDAINNISEDINGNLTLAGNTLSNIITLEPGVTLNNSSGSGLTRDFFITKIQTTPTDIYVFANSLSLPVTAGKVYLYERESDYQYLYPLDSGLLNAAGMVHFNNVLSLDYFVKVVADTLVFPNLFPTYYGNFTLWDSVATWTHSCTTNDTIYITVASHTNSGTGTISGRITQSANYQMVLPGGGMEKARNLGDPVPGVDVKLGQPPGGQPLAYTTTNSAGKYYFNNLNIGSYTVLVDIPGLGRDSSYTINITASSSHFTNLNYIADSDYVFIDSLTQGINRYYPKEDGITVSPNPFNSRTTINFDESQKSSTIRIMDIVGKAIRTISNFSGKQLIIEKGDLTAGVYFIEITTDVGITRKKIVVN